MAAARQNEMNDSITVVATTTLVAVEPFLPAVDPIGLDSIKLSYPRLRPGFQVAHSYQHIK